MQEGQRSIVVAQLSAARASVLALAALLPRQKRSAAAPLLEGFEANVAAAIALLGVEFVEESAPDPDGGIEPGGCADPNGEGCTAPAARQRSVGGMGDGPSTWMCLDCGGEHQQ